MGFDRVPDRTVLGHPLRRDVLRGEPARARDQRDQRDRSGRGRVLRRPDDVRLPARVPDGARVPRSHRLRLPRRRPGHHDSRNVATSTSRRCSATGTRSCGRARSRSSRSTRASPISTTGRSGAGATAGSRSSSPRGRGAEDLRPAPPPAAGPGTGRERNVVYDAGDAIECLQRSGVRLVLSGHKHVPYVWRLEDLFVVNAGTVSSLRLRGNTRPCYNLIEIDGKRSTSGAAIHSTAR